MHNIQFFSSNQHHFQINSIYGLVNFYLIFYLFIYLIYYFYLFWCTQFYKYRCMFIKHIQTNQLEAYPRKMRDIVRLKLQEEQIQEMQAMLAEAQCMMSAINSNHNNDIQNNCTYRWQTDPNIYNNILHRQKRDQVRVLRCSLRCDC